MLKEQLNLDLKQSMLKRDVIRTSVIRELLTLLMEFEKSKNNSGINENVEITILSKCLKQHKETLETGIKVNRIDVIEKENSMISIIENYLPQQLSNEELETKIRNIIQEQSLLDVNKIVGTIMKDNKGKVDPQKVRSIATDFVNTLTKDSLKPVYNYVNNKVHDLKYQNA